MIDVVEQVIERHPKVKNEGIPEVLSNPTGTMAMRERYNIDELRGFACLLLVSLHVIGHSPEVGMRLEEGSLLRYTADSWLFVRMPLFTFISGLVYALRPVRREHLPDFYSKKLRRLGIPLRIGLAVRS